MRLSKIKIIDPGAFKTLRKILRIGGNSEAARAAARKTARKLGHK